MKVLVTGAAGYIGATVVGLLGEGRGIGGNEVTRVALLDRVVSGSLLGSAAPSPAYEEIQGDLGDAAVLERVKTFAPDVTIHLAAIPGGAAEADYHAGRRINLDATLALFETLAETKRELPPVVVYASTVAVYGTQLPAVVKPDTPLRPPITYGAHKLACEILLADLSRRGWLDGRAVRLPGIVARESSGPGLVSAFMSNVMFALRRGERFTSPVSPQATAWWMSARRCAQNLLHAAAMDVTQADPGRAWPLPVLRLSMEQVVATLGSLYGADRPALVDYAPQPAVEAVFGNYPVLDDASSRALGLRDDGSPEALVRRALGELQDE